MNRNALLARPLSLLLAGAALVAVTGVSAPAQASDRTTFEGANAGAIPDGGSGCPNPGAPLDVSFNVFNMTYGAALTDVRIDGLVISHAYVGDVTVTLIAPDTTTKVTLFARTGTGPGSNNGDSSDLAGPYRFSDRATGPSWWQAASNVASATAVPPGTYRATTETGAPTSITGAFAGVNDANGSWVLRFTDACAFDTGSVSQANLQLEVAGERCASKVAALGSAQDAYTASQTVAGNASQGVSDATEPLVTAQNARGAAQTAVTTARAAVTTARAGAQQARTAQDTAADAVLAANVALGRATTTSTKAQVATTKAQAALAAAKKSHRKAAIAKAAAALRKAQRALKAAAAKVATATKKVAAAKAGLATARQAAAVKEHALQVADDALDAARDTLDQAKADLSAAEATYAAAIRVEAVALTAMDLAAAAVEHATQDLFDCTDE